MAVAQPGMVCAPASSNTVRFGPLAKAGGSLTGFTVKEKELVLVDAPSDTEIETVAEPNAFGAGRTLTVRFPPEPPKLMLLTGTKLGSEEPATKVRFAKGVSGSVKEN